MPVAPVEPPSALRESLDPVTRLTNFPQRTYPLRVLGMSLASLPLIAVMRELNSPWPAWAWMIFSCFLWPHIATVWARRSSDPIRGELRNFVIDSLLAGSWVPLMHFSLLPSAVLLSVAFADKVNVGIRNLWLYSLPGQALALLLMGWLTGFAFQPTASMTVVVASLPILVIHTLVVSVSSYRLLRKVQRQNAQLEQISRIDALTNLDSRGYWQQQATRLLSDHQSHSQPATIMLLDVDQFKAINDRFGHAVGDDVLRGIAELLRRHLPAGAHAGRLGGDEFAITVALAMVDAQIIAENIRMAVETLYFSKVPGLHCSVSIGLANPPAAELGLREWIEAADRALYRAKHEGRNRTVGIHSAQERSA